MSEAKHTPGPWEARASRESDDFGIIAPDTSAEDGWVCLAECFSDIRRANERALPEAAANARRIVQCVNAHDDLVAAATQAARWIAQEMAAKDWPGERVANPPKGSHLFNLRAAIAKATGSGA